MHPVTREIILAGARPSAADAFAAFYRLEELRRVRDHVFAGIDALLLPTVPTVYTVAQVLADPIQLNSRLGTYTNFVNLLELCGLAVPAAMHADGTPFGVTLLAPAGHDAVLASIGRVFHAATGLPLGALGLAQPPLAPLSARRRPVRSRSRWSARIFGGMPLNGELKSLGARLLEAAITAPTIGCMRSPAPMPAKPGLLRVAQGAGARDRDRNLGHAGGAFGRLRRRRPAAAVDRHAQARRWPRRARLSGGGRGDRRRARHFELRRLARLSWRRRHVRGFEWATAVTHCDQLTSSIRLTWAADHAPAFRKAHPGLHLPADLARRGRDGTSVEATAKIAAVGGDHRLRQRARQADRRARGPEGLDLMR